jgi:hypothetical protein
MIVPAILLGIVGIVGIFSLRYLQMTAGLILSHNYRTIEETRTMERVVRRIEVSLLDTGSTDTRSLLLISEEFDKSLIRCEHTITEPGEDTVLAAIRTVWEQLKLLVPIRDEKITLSEFRD